ncbi:bifunctional NAD(P)H-hydrate repair enzyme [Nocardioides phosphati]|uniref:Bifunctional NAD(P)H-hydrate repair enzyme n=1 Tax=Nocardioides phosphati TaxID=1867775 RepID=A0ABQ2N9Z7_9ACTN|nr:NAD(P)H-hydrate dehydratase [Nocardioides phosphati]GGO90029.1 bifunctional NAD(P)H-hydrate repair enzyme [Nocardioides phosphati]
MRHAHTVAQVRAAEEASPDLASGVLMQRAARGLAHAVIDLLGGAYGRRVVLLVGSGDNGGDALYAGAYLARRGALVDAWLLSERAHPGGLAALRAAGGRTVASAARADVVVDGIVGIGGRPGLRREAVAACRALGVRVGADEHARPLVVSVDLPSGLDADTGRVEGSHVMADLTVTFGTEKVAHLVDPAAAACGTVHLVDIGLDLPAAAVEALQQADVATLLPVPEGADHKYTRGVVGVRAGSATYPGAARLCVAGAASGLVGMVRFRAVDGDEDTARRVVAARPEVVTNAGRVQAWVVGSGGGDRAADALAEAVGDGVPVVVDADALAAVDGPLAVPAVLTPHAGELAQLLGMERAEVEADQLSAVRRAADRFGAVVLLKGRRTLVAEPAGRVRVNTTGTPWLATAGAGDVLAGLIGSLLAAGLDPFDAASVGCWLHGAAATAASAGGPLTASAVADALSAAVRRVLPTP